MLGTLVFLLFVSGGCGVTVGTRIADIGDNLGRALTRAIDFPNDNFTDDKYNASYKMEVKFDSKGMAGLYNVTTFFMDLILPKDILPEGKDNLIVYFLYTLTLVVINYVQQSQMPRILCHFVSAVLFDLYTI